MMGTLFDHLKQLYAQELYSNSKNMANLILSIYESNRAFLSPIEYFHTIAYFAYSLYNEQQYREGEVAFRQALQAKKAAAKALRNAANKLTDSPGNVVNDMFGEVELKFRLAKCLVHIKQVREAIGILQTLSIKQRTPKINMMLSKLLHNNNHERNAVPLYKEVLKECPLAFEAIEGLLNAGVKGAEVNSLIMNSALAPNCSDWLGNWIKAHAHIHARQYAEAIQTLKSIEATTFLKNYHQLLVLIGECYYHNGEYDNAFNYLKRAHSMHPHMKQGIQILAVLLAKKNKLSDLEKMIAPTLFPYEYSSEYWFLIGQYLYATHKYDKAVYFVQKSCFLNPKNTEALILKAKILLQMKKYQEAIAHLQFTQQFAPHRYEVHKGLVETCLQMHRVREAQAQAGKAVRQLGESPRLLVLQARTYMKETASKNKAKPFLVRALELNENYLPAVFMLAELLQDENDSAGAIKLLKKQISVQPNCKLHSMLGDILINCDKDHTGALENYTIALNLDPTNSRAMAGLLGLGQSSSVADTSYVASSATDEVSDMLQDNPLEMVEIPTNAQGDPESESDIMWSDLEIEINNA